MALPVHDAPERPALPVLSSPTQLATAVRLGRELVELPEWGIAVWVWELTARELDAYKQGQINTKGAKISYNLRANTVRLLCYAIRNESGERMYGERDVDRLLDLPASGIEKLARAARELSGLGDDDDEDAEGNSEPDQIGPSSSTSPSDSDAPSLS